MIMGFVCLSQSKPLCMCLLGLHGRQFQMEDSSIFRVHGVNISGFFLSLKLFSYSDSDDKNQKEHSGDWRVMQEGYMFIYPPCLVSSNPCVLAVALQILWFLERLFHQAKTTEESEANMEPEMAVKPLIAIHCETVLSSPRLAEKSGSCSCGHGVGYPSHQEREGRRPREKGKRNKDA